MTDSDRVGREYRLVIRGELDDRYGLLFEGMRMERDQGATMLTGTIVDQAHLLGVIEQIQELGLELLSAKQTNQPNGAAKQGSGPGA